MRNAFRPLQTIALLAVGTALSGVLVPLAHAQDPPPDPRATRVELKRSDQGSQIESLSLQTHGIEITEERVDHRVVRQVRIRGVLRGSGSLLVRSPLIPMRKVATNCAWKTPEGVRFETSVPLSSMKTELQIAYVDLKGKTLFEKTSLIVEEPADLPSKVQEILASEKPTEPVKLQEKLPEKPQNKSQNKSHDRKPANESEVQATSPKSVQDQTLTPASPRLLRSSELGLRGFGLQTPMGNLSLQAELFASLWSNDFLSNHLGAAFQYSHSLGQADFPDGNFSLSSWNLDLKYKFDSSRWKERASFGISASVKSETFEVTRQSTGLGIFGGVPLHLTDGLNVPTWLELQAHDYPITLSSSGALYDGSVYLDLGVSQSIFFQIGVQAERSVVDSTGQTFTILSGSGGVGWSF